MHHWLKGMDASVGLHLKHEDYYYYINFKNIYVKGLIETVGPVCLFTIHYEGNN